MNIFFESDHSIFTHTLQYHKITHNKLYTAKENGPLIVKFKIVMQRLNKKHSLETPHLQTSVLSCF